jgi:CBS domain containing-hemolysin-like protein
LNTDLKALIELHTHNALQQIDHLSENKLTHVNQLGINVDQKNLIISAFELKETSAHDIMIPMDNVYMIDYDQKIGKKELNEILEKGFSRIPVYEYHKSNLVGVLRIKQLIGIDFKIPKTIRELNLKLKMPLIMKPSMKIYDILAEFRKGKSHMAILTKTLDTTELPAEHEHNWRFSSNSNSKFRVSGHFSEFSQEIENQVGENFDIEGMLTLEDVIENIIKIKILDEDDYQIKRIANKLSKYYIIIYNIILYCII